MSLQPLIARGPKFIFYLFLLLFMEYSCKEEMIVLSDENDLISLLIDESAIAVSHSASNAEIILTIPFDFDLSQSFGITTLISDGASIFPSGNTINLNNVTSFVVTAENGDRKRYEIRIVRLPNDANFIQSFSIEHENEIIEGEIDQNSNEISLDLPSSFDFSSFDPEITISENATLTTNQVDEIDFESSLSYTVTSESGSAKNYTVRFNRIENDENQILFFDVSPDGESFLSGTIDHDLNQILLEIPFNYDIRSLTVSAVLSPFAEIEPSLDLQFDFTKEISFEVHAENGEQRTYAIVIDREEDQENYITSFSFPDENGGFIQANSIDDVTGNIIMEVPFGYDLNAVVPSIEISSNATINPSISNPQNFNESVEYSVSSPEGIIRTYSVMTSFLPNTENFILTFTIPTGDETINGAINNENNTITLSVPFAFDLTNVVPEITVSANASVSPNSGLSQNIEENTVYTVSAENGDVRSYNIVIVRGPNPASQIISYKLPNGETPIVATIDEENLLIHLVLPFGFDPSNLTPEIEISENAKIQPSSTNGFTEGISYLVTAENGNRSIYNTSITFEESPYNFITVFNLEINGEFVSAEIDDENNLLKLSINTAIELSNNRVQIEISENATINTFLSYIESDLENKTYVVTAENGDQRTYTVQIERTTSSENTIEYFGLLLFGVEFPGMINNDTNQIFIEVPQKVSLDNVPTNITIPEYSTIFPPENVAQNFTTTVTYSVSAQNGDIRDYDVIVHYIDPSTYTQSFALNCNNEVNFRHWFGGDDRDQPQYQIGPRNVGAGQVVILEQNLLVDNFAFLLDGGFRYSSTNQIVNQNLTIRLDIRSQDGSIIQSKDKTIFSNFSTLWVEFDLSEFDLVLLANNQYNFTFYLLNGEDLEVNTGIAGNNSSRSITGDCYQRGITGTSKQIEGTSLTNWSTWYILGPNFGSNEQTNFNFRLNGKTRGN